jgi:hypothetical protein
MENAIHKEEKTCTFEDMAKLETAMCKAKQELRFTGIFVLVISFILPFLPPKYSGTKGMLDIMSYSQVVAGIVTVFGVVFLWSVYYMLYGLHKDLKHKTKIAVNTYVTSTGGSKYKGKQYFYFSAAGLPYRISRVPINKDEFDMLKKGDQVVAEYSKFGKRFLGWIKV